MLYKCYPLYSPFIGKGVDVRELRLTTADSQICLCRRLPLDQNPLQVSLNLKAWLLAPVRQAKGLWCAPMHRQATIYSACSAEVVHVYLCVLGGSEGGSGMYV